MCPPPAAPSDAAPGGSADVAAPGGSVGTPAPGGSSSQTSDSQALALPTLTGKQLVTTGKGKHKHVIGFQLNFNAPLNAAAAQDASDYTVVQHTKHGHKTISRPVAFRAVYNASSDSVQLLLKGRPKFAQGGKIVVNPTSPARSPMPPAACSRARTATRPSRRPPSPSSPAHAEWPAQWQDMTGSRWSVGRTP